MSNRTLINVLALTNPLVFVAALASLLILALLVMAAILIVIVAVYGWFALALYGWAKNRFSPVLSEAKPLAESIESISPVQDAAPTAEQEHEAFFTPPATETDRPPFLNIDCQPIALAQAAAPEVMASAAQVTTKDAYRKAKLETAANMVKAGMSIRGSARLNGVPESSLRSFIKRQRG